MERRVRVEVAGAVRPSPNPLPEGEGFIDMTFQYFNWIYLAVPLLAFVCAYSLTKRFTSLSHFSLALGPVLIERFRAMHIGQTIRDVVPQGHQKKAGRKCEQDPRQVSLHRDVSHDAFGRCITGSTRSREQVEASYAYSGNWAVPRRDCSWPTWDVPS